MVSFSMRRWFFLLPLLCLAGLRAQPAELPADEPDPLAGAPAPLAEAVRRYAADSGRWAYTQHTVETDGKGKVKESRIYRHDPSQHYDVQWTLLERDGKPPTERQQKRFRERMAKRPERERKALGELMTWSAAKLVGETADTLTYEVPLKQDRDQRFPPEKFQVLVEIDRASRLRHIDLKLRDSVRVAGVVKVKSGEGRIEFVSPLPDHGPTVSRVELNGTASILFVPVGAGATVTRSDIRRVTPYDERFQVQIGPLKTIDF
jgi:hypothetical protein